MSCNCIENIHERLEEHRLELAIMWSRTANTLTSRTFTALERKDTGKPERRSGKPKIFAHTFCPFCGARYEPKEAAAQAQPQPEAA